MMLAEEGLTSEVVEVVLLTVANGVISQPLMASEVLYEIND